MKINLRFLYIDLLALIVLAVGGQVFAQTANPGKVDDGGSSVFEAVYKSLLEKPKWLFADDVCPADLFPKVENDDFYEFELCSKYADVCLEKCKNDDGGACYSLAVSIQMKQGLAQDLSEFLLLRACRLGTISGCTNRAAAILNLNPSDPKSESCAFKTFEKTCEKNDPWGCAMLGTMIYQGQAGQAKDPEKALKALSKSCDKYGEEDEACQSARKLIEEIKKSTTINQK